MTKKNALPGEMITDLASHDSSTTKTKFIYPYGPKRKVKISFVGEGRTKQSFKAECDINTIMARYMKTGVLEHVRTTVAQYLDVTGADFQEAQELVAGANSMFHELPSEIRTKFKNSPALFLEFMENPANAQEAVALGLQTAQAEASHPPTKETPSVEPEPRTANVEASAKGGEPKPALPGGQTILNT